LNQLVTALLAAGSHAAASSVNSELATVASSVEPRAEIHEAIASDGVSATRSSIGALKGIATFLRNQGDLNLACLMFAVAAERIALAEGAEAASHELGAAAALARRNGRTRLAEALWRESLRRDPVNLRSSSGLGQLLHHQGRYREAAAYLEAPSRVDNNALLFLGWSLTLDEAAGDEAHAMQRGPMMIVKALNDWSYQNGDLAQRESWLRHVRRLSRLGPAFRHEVEEVIAFANMNSRWPKLEEEEIRAGSEAVMPTDDQIAAA
jgi:hypothetical protein